MTTLKLCLNIWRKKIAKIFISFKVVSFTTPIYSDVYKLFMVRPKQSFSWTTYTDVFEYDFWIAVIIYIVTMSMFTYMEFKCAGVSVTCKKARFEIVMRPVKMYVTKRLGLSDNFGVFACKLNNLNLVLFTNYHIQKRHQIRKMLTSFSSFFS